MNIDPGVVHHEAQSELADPPGKFVAHMNIGLALAALERPPEVAPESKAGVASAESSDAAARSRLTMSPNDTHMAGSQQQQQQQQSAVVRKFASSFSDVNLS